MREEVAANKAAQRHPQEGAAGSSGMGSVPMLRRWIETGMVKALLVEAVRLHRPALLLCRHWFRSTRARDRRAGRPSCFPMRAGKAEILWFRPWLRPADPRNTRSLAAGELTRSACPRPSLQIRFFQQTFILMRHEMRLDLGDEVHDHHNHDQQRGATEIERSAKLGLHECR